MSGNHKKSLKRALRIVDLAADCGANAIFQTFNYQIRLHLIGT